MRVRVYDRGGATRWGDAAFSRGRGKPTVTVVFSEPLSLATRRLSMVDFYLVDHGRVACFWKRGDVVLDGTWALDERDAQVILDGGGG